MEGIAKAGKGEGTVKHFMHFSVISWKVFHFHHRT